jgi:hypothetical protein
MSKRRVGKRGVDMTPVERAMRDRRLGWSLWNRTTATGISPDRLEADMRRVAADQDAAKAARRSIYTI